MIRPRTNHTSAVLNGEIYVIGGTSKNPPDRFFNSAESENTSNTSKCIPLYIFVCLFVLGTTSDQVEVEHYDPYSDTWALTCPALKYVTNFTASACQGKLYVIGSCAVKYNALAMQCYNPVIGKNLKRV